jgi:hypothetical protein
MEWVLKGITNDQTKAIEESLEDRYGPGGAIAVGPVGTESLEDFTES